MAGPFSLIVERGLGVPTVVDLAPGCLLIGSSSGCNVIVPDRYVSRRHAEITVDSRHSPPAVRDLSSKNGTAVNGVRLGADPQRLQTGDCVELAGGRVVARIVGSHSTEPLPPGITVGVRTHALVVNPEERSATLDGRRLSLRLSGRQWDMLARLVATKGNPVSGAVLKQAGWPDAPGDSVTDMSLRSQISRMRRAISISTGGQVTLVHVPGAGYVLG
jgi:DNA-binding winged helix-turn-helix (wHTH) protein